MKSTYEKAEKSITEYPCLGVSTSSGVIVLFSSHEVGMVVREGGSYEVGDYDICWHMPSFKKLSGSVTLEN